MTRKDFLSVGAGGFFGILMTSLLTRCSSSSSPSNPTTDRTFSSSSENGHTHTITLQKAEVETPPASGINRATSSSSGHTHNFVMTQAELQTVLGGGSVVITVSLVDAHVHSFTVTKWF
ncbi:MAG: hypothetical protein ACYDH0_02345 [Candidatus Aminicenantales bacterium]